MPGPRAKQNSGKKNRQKTVTPQNSAVLGLASESSLTIPTNVLNTLDELSNHNWDKVAKVLCDHFGLPGTCTPLSSTAEY